MIINTKNKTRLHTERARQTRTHVNSCVWEISFKKREESSAAPQSGDTDFALQSFSRELCSFGESQAIFR